jgi:hypothetical protein
MIIFSSPLPIDQRGKNSYGSTFLAIELSYNN